MNELTLLDWVHNLGVFGPWVMLPAFVAASMIVPSPILGIAAGTMFGTAVGFVVLTLSTALSAGMVFLAGRHLTRVWVFKVIESSGKIRVLDDAVTEGGWKMVALIRLTVILPFSVINYGLGLSKISFRHYMWATVIAMMPGSWVYAHLGSLAKQVLVEGQKPERITLEWIFAAIGLTVTLGMGAYATWRVRQILSKYRKASKIASVKP